MGLPELGFLAALLFTVALLVRRKWRQRQANPDQLPLPPGPRGLPILGNLLDIPIELPWIGFNKMSQTYGDIMHLSVLGQSIIILSSADSVSDLLEKRSMLYSDRSQSAILNMMNCDWLLTFMGYGEKWRRTRRAFHQYLNTGVVDAYQEVQMQQSRALLRRLLKTPEDFFRHTRLTFGATIMQVMYGIQVSNYNDQYISIAEEAMRWIVTGSQVGRYWVEFFPLLRYIPEWVPGAGFQRDAATAKVVVSQMRDKAFDHAKELFNKNVPTPCITTSMLERLTEDPTDEGEEIARDSTGVAYGGGSDTTVSATNCFILAMVSYPNIQRKAQEELDAVVGPNRLPDFSDRPSLPYIEAIVKETLRWKSVTPLAVAHKVTENDEYRGFLIPKGALVMGNAWAILHDAQHYQDPFSFSPDRFLKDGELNPDILDPTKLCFGFGRRICPGRHFAVNSLWSAIASILHTFNIMQAMDAKGKPVPVAPQFTSGIVSSPGPFQCSFKPRSSAAEALILGDIRREN